MAVKATAFLLGSLTVGVILLGAPPARADSSDDGGNAVRSVRTATVTSRLLGYAYASQTMLLKSRNASAHHGP